MPLDWEQVIVDSSDPEVLGRWWASALDWVIVNDDPEEFEIRPAPDQIPRLLFSLAYRGRGQPSTNSISIFVCRPES
jgi:hypothetical protein